ncbi:MAG: thymidine phosphorylase [Verrucomicrobia bacterium]|nr:thymidine phosphorylase [Verrucomicrobiota bacterium]
MRAVDLIRKKRDGLALDAQEIDAFVSGATSGAWPDYQLSAMLMAIRWRGMTPEETAWLTGAMVRSGVRLDWPELPGAKADKHSTGGVGDKTSLVIVPLVAACGVLVPMISGRGLGHTGGTLDKLEAIPGFRVGLSLPEFRQALAKVGCAMIGQTAEIAPADKKLYALRDVTATVDSIPLISASIMSKKIAEGISALVLDVKCGLGAFMKNRSEARELAESLVAIGHANGVKTEALLTSMDAPLGRAVGNSLEVIEVLETLKGRGSADLEALSISLAARMLRQSGAAASDKVAERMIRDALVSGRALEKFRQMIEQQGGDGRIADDSARLPIAPFRAHLKADRTGFVHELDAERVGRAAMTLGAGRERAEDAIDPAVGAIVLRKPGDRVKTDEPILELHYRDASRLDAALALLRNACRIEEEAPPRKALILETVV